MKPNLLFYDTETTGLNPCFDQVLQFAAVRTDINLEEIERHEMHVKLNPDVIPAPYALITHQIELSTSLNGLSEFEAMREIHQYLNTPNTCSLGYNTLSFDDELLRFSFYRNLLPPYTHQYANQCRRADIYPIAILYYLFAPEVCQWPVIDNKLSLKLEDIAEINQFNSGQAHDAMADVVATIQLAQLFFRKQEMWQYALSCFDKNIDKKRFYHLPTGITLDQLPLHEALLVHGRMGARQKFIAPAISLGAHNHYQNQHLWLRLDTDDFSRISPEDLINKVFVMRKRWGEAPILLPARERYLQQLSTDSLKLKNSNKNWLQKHTNVLRELISYHQNYLYETPPHLDIDAALYDLGFPNPIEQKLMNEFHNAELMNKANIALQFETNEHRELALKILARHYPQALSSNDRQVFQAYLHQIYQGKIVSQDYKGNKRFTLPEALQEIENLLTDNKLSKNQIKILKTYKNYLTSIIKNF